jgi:hypothetical protein
LLHRDALDQPPPRRSAQLLKLPVEFPRRDYTILLLNVAAGKWQRAVRVWFMSVILLALAICGP